MLSKELVQWLLVANIIAWPIADIIINKWLQNFAYRIDIQVWIFLLAGIIALIIALITPGIRASKAALANPVTSLRYEQEGGCCQITTEFRNIAKF